MRKRSARSWLAAFPHANTRELAPRVTTLRDEVTKTKERLLTDLKDRIASYAQRKDAQRLQELRNSLPAPLLGSPIEAQIVAELEKLDAEAQARNQAVLKDVATDLVKWDFPRVEERHRTLRASMGDSVAGTTFDSFLTCAQTLPRFAEALDTTVKASSGRKVRFIGELQKMINPDLLGATRSGLTIQAPIGSGEIEVAWKSIDPATLRELAAQITGDRANEFAPAFDALAQARAHVAK